MSDQHHPEAPSDVEARTLALESLLREKGVLTSEDVDRVISAYEQDIGPMIGAHLVARAWVDPAYRQRLLHDAPSAVRELGYEYRADTRLVVIPNEPGVHNMVVCTLCSCYPWMVLGLPPTWYKSAPYRSRAVREPRAVLAELGLQLPDAMAINVWDSSSEVRYMILPERPPGTEGWTEEALAAIVTRDCMIGVARPQAPALTGAPR
ncbi:MAG TPA: nitrile hydratase subunit alpha [Candidatus Limnocylindrales bacterium]|nr:nitrile hydratase subunit alpha [Candidatus Limnocylindrales bacterium]